MEKLTQDLNELNAVLNIINVIYFNDRFERPKLIATEGKTNKIILLFHVFKGRSLIPCVVFERYKKLTKGELHAILTRLEAKANKRLGKA